VKRFSPLLFLIGLVLFALILSRVDISTCWQLLKNANPGWVTLAFLFLVPEVLLKAWRIRQLTRETKHSLSLTDATLVYLSGQPLASVTPAKVGDVARVLLLSKRSGMSMAQTLAVHVADKVLDLAALGLLASIGLITLISESQETGPYWSALAGIGVGILLMAAFLNRNWVSRFVKPVILALAPKRAADDLHHHGREFYHHFESFFLPIGRLTGPFLLSLLAWEAALVRALFCAKALSLPLDFIHLQWLLPVVAIVEFLPISIMGFGTREAALFLFFGKWVKPEGLIPFSLMMVLVGPLASAVLGVPVAALIEPNATRRK